MAIASLSWTCGSGHHFLRLRQVRKIYINRAPLSNQNNIYALFSFPLFRHGHGCLLAPAVASSTHSHPAPIIPTNPTTCLHSGTNFPDARRLAIIGPKPGAACPSSNTWEFSGGTLRMKKTTNDRCWVKSKRSGRRWGGRYPRRAKHDDAPKEPMIAVEE